MPNNLLSQLLAGELTTEDFNSWFTEDLNSNDCRLKNFSSSNKTEFVNDFLEFVRGQIESVVQSNAQGSSTSHNNNTSEKPQRCESLHKPINEERSYAIIKKNNKSPKTGEDLNLCTKKTNPGVKTALINTANKLNEENTNTCKLISNVRVKESGPDVSNSFLTSTPNKFKSITYSRTTFDETVNEELNTISTINLHGKQPKDNNTKLDSPKPSQSNGRIKDKSTLVFGDFIQNSKAAKIKKNKKKSTSPITDKNAERSIFDISSTEMFPEIGESSKSLNSSKDKNNVNLSSEMKPLSGVWQTTESELKTTNKEHSTSVMSKTDKLMYRFTNPDSTLSTPNRHSLLYNSKADSEDINWVKADLQHVFLKSKIDKLVDMYIKILELNLVVNFSSDLYLFMLVLLSKQDKQKLEDLTIRLYSPDVDLTECLLKTIHNSTYFAVSVLYHQRQCLNFILDKNSLKILGENKIVRNFSCPLAKFLLDIYGIRCDLEHTKTEKLDQDSSAKNTHGIVCWNTETDNVENFPSIISFQTFKKQRDLFYEIYRWYPGSNEQSAALNATTLRSRIKSLLATAVSPANHAHLASLFVAHMISECTDNQQCKLTKLQRRLTIASSQNNYKLPAFETNELFYKDFLTLTENESFRTHVRDILISEIHRLDAGTTLTTEIQNAKNMEITLTDDFVKLTKSLRLLSKFLGYLTSLPYCQVPVDFAIKTGGITINTEKEKDHTVPKERIVERELLSRKFVLPTIDLKDLLDTAIVQCKLSVTIPWMVQYLAMIDYTTLRTVFYSEFINDLLSLYIHNLLMKSRHMKTETRMYLTFMMNWLFELPHFSIDEFQYDMFGISPLICPQGESEDSIDSADLIDHTNVAELCPFLKRFQNLLLMSYPAQDAKTAGTFRHVTPITITLSAEDKLKIKELELQARLAQELLKNQPISTQRVIEVVIERVTACCFHDFRLALSLRKEKCRIEAIKLVKEFNGKGDLLVSLKEMYAAQLTSLFAEFIGKVDLNPQWRVQSAIHALVNSSAEEYLMDTATKSIKGRLLKWIREHLSSTEVLCKDIEAEMKMLLKLGDNVAIPQQNATLKIDNNVLLLSDKEFDAVNVSPSRVLLDLKELTCQLLEEEELSYDLITVLKQAFKASKEQNIMMRPPTKKTIFQLSVDLCIVYLSVINEELNDSILEKFEAIWNVCCPNRCRDEPELEQNLHESYESPNYEDDRMPTPVSDEENENPKVPTKFIVLADTSSDGPQPETSKPNCNAMKESDEMLDYFTRVFCPRNIRILAKRTKSDNKTWENMGKLLVMLIDKQYITEDQLTEQLALFFRMEWPMEVLNNVSRCIKFIISNRESQTPCKFSLFMEFFAEFMCTDHDV